MHGYSQIPHLSNVFYSTILAASTPSSTKSTKTRSLYFKAQSDSQIVVLFVRLLVHVELLEAELDLLGVGLQLAQQGLTLRPDSTTNMSTLGSFSPPCIHPCLPPGLPPTLHPSHGRTVKDVYVV